MSYNELEYGYQGLYAAGHQQAHFYVDAEELELLMENNDGSRVLTDMDMEDGFDCSKQVVVGVCAMAKKSQSKPMKEILTRLEEFEYLKITVFNEETILNEPVESWPHCDCLISFHSKGFPLDKAIAYASQRNPYVINNLHMQYDIQDRRKVYAILEHEGIEIPRYSVLNREPGEKKDDEEKDNDLVESEDHVEVNGIIFNKPFVEKPVSAEDHNIYIYYPTSAGGGSQRLFRKIGSRSSVYSPESRVRKTGSYIYEDFMPTDGTDVKVYTVGPDYAHAEARKSPALDGKVERDSEGKEIRYPVILSNAEKLISRKVCLAFKQAVCGFDLLRANGKSYVCDVNGFSFVKNSNKYYDDCAKILGNMILRELAPQLHIPWSVPFQLDDPPIVPTTFGKMMELRCVVAVIRHGDRTPKQKMKVEVRHPKFFEIFSKYDGYKHGHVKLKKPKQLQEILDIARALLEEVKKKGALPEIEEKQAKLEQLKSVLEMYGHFSGINRKVQLKYQPHGRPRGSSSDDVDILHPANPSLVLILKWGGELTPAGRIQAEELGRMFRCMYPGGQGRHLSGECTGTQGLGLLRLHSTFRHDLKIYASDEGRVQMTAAAFAKGLLALEGELTPILVQMVKSANTNGLLDNDRDSSKYQNMCKARLHELMQAERVFTEEDKQLINPCKSESIAAALEFVKNPAECCRKVHAHIHALMDIVNKKMDDPKHKDSLLYHGETWELMGRRWGKIEKDFCNKNRKYDISKIPDIYDCIKYDLQHNQHTLQFEQAEELYMWSKYLADIVIPQEYGLTSMEKLTIGQGICTPLLKKIRADLQHNIEESGENEETVNRLNPRYSHGVSSPGRHVRTRLYFTSESHVHSLLTVLRYGGLLDIVKDEQWRRAMQYVSMVSELNYMSQIVIMLYEDPTKDPSSEERFHIELHFSPGVNCCVQKNLPPGPGFRPHSRSDSGNPNNGKDEKDEKDGKEMMETSDSETPLPITSTDGLRNDSDKVDGDRNNIRKNPLRIEEEFEGSSASITPVEQQYKTSYDDLFKPAADMFDENQVFTVKKRPKSSQPIAIRSAHHTVSGHEASHLAQRLSDELAHQNQTGARSRSYETDEDRADENAGEDKCTTQKPKCESLLLEVVEEIMDNLLIVQDTPLSFVKIPRRFPGMLATKGKSLDLPFYHAIPEMPEDTPRSRRNSNMSNSSDLETQDQFPTGLDTDIDVLTKLKTPRTPHKSLSLPSIENFDIYLNATKPQTSLLTSHSDTSNATCPEVPPGPVECNAVEGHNLARSHRHSIAGQMSYFKMFGYGYGAAHYYHGLERTVRPIKPQAFGPLCFLKKMQANGQTGNSLFSTAVISGSSSAPNLSDMIPNTAPTSTIQGIGGVPPIRPLETLHNALSYRQLDAFLERMTTVALYRTPAPSPPKNPSTPVPTALLSSAVCLPGSQINDRAILDIKLRQFGGVDGKGGVRLQQSPNSGVWSGTPSLISSSSGQSSPNFTSDPFSGNSSDVSAGIQDYRNVQSYPRPTFVDEDLDNLDIFSDNPIDDGSGEITPVSCGSDFELSTGHATLGSTIDADITVTEDLTDEALPDMTMSTDSTSNLLIPSGMVESTDDLAGSCTPKADRGGFLDEANYMKIVQYDPVQTDGLKYSASKIAYAKADDELLAPKVPSFFRQMSTPLQNKSERNSPLPDSQSDSRLRYLNDTSSYSSNQAQTSDITWDWGDDEKVECVEAEKPAIKHDWTSDNTELDKEREIKSYCDNTIKWVYDQRLLSSDRNSVSLEKMDRERELREERANLIFRTIATPLQNYMLFGGRKRPPVASKDSVSSTSSLPTRSRFTTTLVNEKKLQERADNKPQSEHCD